QTVLVVYLGVAAASIAVLHWLEAHQDWKSNAIVKLRAYLPALIQFAFGTLWSAFLVFYWRSGVVAASWPFLLVLAAIFVGNEVFKRYHTRLVFTTTLFFFALISYAAFMVPVFVHKIGQLVFLLSGAASVIFFAAFLWLLNILSQGKLGEMKRQIAIGGVTVYAAVTGLYFLNVLPPLPLAMQESGVYHSLCRVPPSANARVRCVGRPIPGGLARGDGLYYRAMGEPTNWTSWFGFPTLVHVEPGAQVIVFGAVFAPIDLNTVAYHVWQRYDDASGTWRTVQQVPNSLKGGRGKGYRGFSLKTNPAPGLWRVDFETVDGRLIGRTVFTIVRGQPSALVPVTL
ncbi:MAG TPA: DUF2914 domain-containing protein, partial [Rhizomicrobium sp.]|nr:DUF2914 domain-containing protein [Rhizomicrobium sp.]